MGVGNSLRGDDGIGCYIAKNFREKNWVSLNCGTVPENFTSIIRRNKPEKLVIVDASDMGLKQGEFGIVSEEKIENIGFTTHTLPLSFLIDYLKNVAGKIIFIGVQPKTIKDSEEISDELKKSADKIMSALREERFNEIKKL